MKENDFFIVPICFEPKGTDTIRSPPSGPEPKIANLLSGDIRAEEPPPRLPFTSRMLTTCASYCVPNDPWFSTRLSIHVTPSFSMLSGRYQFVFA